MLLEIPNKNEYLIVMKYFALIMFLIMNFLFDFHFVKNRFNDEIET